MDFSKLPSGPVFPHAGLAGLLLLMASSLPLAAEPVQELKRSIDEAGTAVNRQLGDWLGVAPEKPARRKASTKPKSTAAIPRPVPRPQDIGTVEKASESANAPADAATVSAPVTLAPPAPAATPVEPRPSRRPEPALAAKPQPAPTPAPTPDVTQEQAPQATPAPETTPAAAASDTAKASIPLPTPGPERQLAALPPSPPPAAPRSDEPQAARPEATAVPTICPELSNEDLGVFTPVTVTATNAACTVDRGVSLSAVRMKDGRLVTLAPAATLRCEMAAALARWVRNDIDPAVATLGAPLDTVMVAASQQCRPRNRVVGAKISEHGKGNAIDTRGYVLKDGRRFVIGVPAAGSSDLPMPVAFQELLKASACTEFTTILGPGSDGYHELHLHVDRAERRSGAVLCRWAVAEARAKAPSPPRKPEIPAANDASEGGEAGKAARPDAPPGTENPGTSQ